MADFCKKCHDEFFGEECENSIIGLCKEGEMTIILCEGCGKNIWIDHKGERVK